MDIQFPADDEINSDIPRLRLSQRTRNPAERRCGMPNLTGTLGFIEELKSRTFKDGSAVIKIMESKNFNLQYLQSNGFDSPTVIFDTDYLQMKIPPDLNWTQLEELVGPSQEVEVIDVEKQDYSATTFAHFIKYMKKTKKSRILNLISLECSETRLGEMIEPPAVARELDWAVKYWPENVHFNEDNKRRPNVQKYCLISPKNAFTDFHIDFGGTSVWYHIVKGEKIFYVIRPTDLNNSLFWLWNESRNKLRTFFADQVDECFKVTLSAGSTLFLPTGWIHAVLTVEDSLVYGGNFLHSLNIKQQLHVYSMERKGNTPERYLFPDFENIHWFAAQGLCKELQISNEKNQEVPQYLLQGIKALLTTLRQWLQRAEVSNANSMYFTQDEAVNLLKDLGKQIRIAEREMLVRNPPKPERGSTRTRRRPNYGDFIDFSVNRKKKRIKEGEVTPLEEVVDYGCEDKDQWHILNGGMKVVIKKLALTELPPSTSSEPPTDPLDLDVYEFKPLPEPVISQLERPIGRRVVPSLWQFNPTRKKTNISEVASQVTEEDVTSYKSVHQDENYIYPSLLCSDEEGENMNVNEKDDEPWSPRAKVGHVIPKTDRPCRAVKKNTAVEKGLEAAAADEPSASTSFTVLPSEITRKSSKNVSKALLTRKKRIKKIPSSTDTSSKSKKGSTPKQRLGKILKLNMKKMRR